MNPLRPLFLFICLAAVVASSDAATLVPGAEIAISDATWIPAAGSRSPIAASAGDGIGLVAPRAARIHQAVRRSIAAAARGVALTRR